MPLGRDALTAPLRPGWLRLELPWTRDVRLVMLSGMSGQVLRDSHGIPHLRAAMVLDLARLQGVVTAEDRAWQLEWFRWRMEGRTAEYVGEDGVPWDRFARQVRLEPTVRACYDALDDETRAWVSAYVDGVNEGMSSGLERAPELGLLAAGSSHETVRPRPWEPWTPLGIFWAIHLLFGTFPAKLFNDHVVQQLGADWLPLFHAEGVTQSGSNAAGWRRTASGLPHRRGPTPDHRAARLLPADRAMRDEFDVVGFAFPACPGCSTRACWLGRAGITNAMADYQDLTREELRRRDDEHLEARGITGWAPVIHYPETVSVRGAGPRRSARRRHRAWSGRHGARGRPRGGAAARGRGRVAGWRRRPLQPAHAVVATPRPRVRGFPAATRSRTWTTSKQR